MRKQTPRFTPGNPFSRFVSNRAYLAAVADNRALRAQPREHDPTTLTFEDIRALIEKNEAIGILHEWAQAASEADIILAAQCLIQEADPQKLKLYLMLFRKRHFPLSPARLFELVTWPDGPIPRHALHILANLKDKAIRTLAFHLVETKSSLRYYAINLLVNNFEPGDAETVEAWCDAESDPEVINSFSRSLQEFFVEHPDAERESRLLTKLYEKEPCAHCRYFIVELLLALDSLPDELRRECEYDAYPDTRALLRS